MLRWAMAVEMSFTAVFQSVPDGFIAFVEELPGANAQGATLDEARENLRDAIELVLEANRRLARIDVPDAGVVREVIRVVAA